MHNAGCTLQEKAQHFPTAKPPLKHTTLKERLKETPKAIQCSKAELNSTLHEHGYLEQDKGYHFFIAKPLGKHTNERNAEKHPERILLLCSGAEQCFASAWLFLIVPSFSVATLHERTKKTAYHFSEAEPGCPGCPQAPPQPLLRVCCHVLQCSYNFRQLHL